MLLLVVVLVFLGDSIETGRTLPRRRALCGLREGFGESSFPRYLGGGDVGGKIGGWGWCCCYGGMDTFEG